MICINKPRGCPETFGTALKNTKDEISLLIIIKKFGYYKNFDKCLVHRDQENNMLFLVCHY